MPNTAITADELLAAGGSAALSADPEDLKQVNLLSNIVDKLTRARLRDMDADERAGKIITRENFDKALSSIYSTAESECGPRTWLALVDAGADYDKARNIMLEIQDRIYQRVIAYGVADTTTE